MKLEELTDNQRKAWEIIKEHDIDIDLCEDNFFIVHGWNAVDRLVALFNEVPIDYVDYGKIDEDRVLDEEKEFYTIDEVLGDESWGFDDEYVMCDHCYKVVRTSPDSYSWVARYWVDHENGEIICGDCVLQDFIDEYIESLINNHKSANTILGDKELENLGFVQCNCHGEACEFETGLHEGWNDSPEKILKNALVKNPDKEYIFSITGVEQFGVQYTLYGRIMKREVKKQQ